jgi:2,4-dienoyl-CoA reductase-like NADH-dependent reductase (Old Yellow Enzyme family)
VLAWWFVGAVVVGCVCAAAVGAWVLHLEELRAEEDEADLSDAERFRRAFMADPEWVRQMEESAAQLASGEPLDYSTLEDDQ